MDLTEFADFLELERSGKLHEAKQLLLRLASRGQPLALLELSKHYCQDPGLYVSGRDTVKSKMLADEAIQTLEELADCGDADAMLYLARVYLGDYGTWCESSEAAEHWLLKSFNAGCRSAANDLHRFYLDRDHKKSAYWNLKT